MKARYHVVLQLIADGLSLEDIAKELGLKLNTIKMDAKYMVQEMGADNRAHAVAQGFRQGIIK